MRGDATPRRRMPRPRAAWFTSRKRQAEVTAREIEEQLREIDELNGVGWAPDTGWYCDPD